MKKPNAYLQKQEMFNQALLDVGKERLRITTGVRISMAILCSVRLSLN